MAEQSAAVVSEPMGADTVMSTVEAEVEARASEEAELGIVSLYSLPLHLLAVSGSVVAAASGNRLFVWDSRRSGEVLNSIAASGVARGLDRVKVIRRDHEDVEEMVVDEKDPQGAQKKRDRISQLAKEEAAIAKRGSSVEHHDDIVRSIALSEDGMWLVSGGGERI